METSEGRAAGLGDWRQQLQGNFVAVVQRYGRAWIESLEQAVRTVRVAVRSTEPLVVRVTHGEAVVTLNNGAEGQAFEQALAGMVASMKGGPGVVINGLGNGVVLEWLYRHHPKLYLSMRCPVYVVERSWHVVAANLMVHDWADLLADPGVQCFVGDDAVGQLEKFLNAHLWRATPSVIIGGSSAIDTDLGQRMERIVTGRGEHLAERTAQLWEFYSRIPRSRFAEVLSANPPRRPRVFLITTLFSTVLQYSTRDLGEAFERLGFDVLIDTEPDVYSRCTNLTMAEQMWHFKPDLVMQIDHARFEALAHVVPPQIPFVTWIQDRMEKLYSSDAGGKLAANDIVFTIGGGEEMRVLYGYPDRQVFRLPMGVNSRMFSGQAVESPEPVITYVSHASQSVPQLLIDFQDRTVGIAEEFRERVRAAMADTAATMEQLFASGQAACFEFQWRQVLRQAMIRRGMLVQERDVESRLLDFGYIKIGNALFRHTMLQWASQTDLPLALYGTGWDTHPTLAEYAKGPLAHGPALAEVCRNSLINLQATISGNIHQRVFEGTASGGFFLLRYNLLDVSSAIVHDLLPWLNDHRHEPIADVIAHRDLRAEQKLVLQFLMGRWLERFDTLNDRALELLASYGRIRGIFDFLGPDVQHVYFGSAEQLKERVAFFRSHPADRAAIVASMQKHLQRWEMATVLRERMDDVSRYLASSADLTK